MCTSAELVDPAELTDVALVRRLEDLHRQMTRLQALVLRDIAVLHRRGGAAADGFASTQALLRRRLRLDPRAASRQVAVASTVDDLPDTAGALTNGEISVEHAAAICQARHDLGADVLAGGAEKLLLAEARAESPGRVWRLSRLLRERLDPDDTQGRAGRLFRDRWFDVTRTWRGMVSVQGMLDPAAGELLIAAVDAYTPSPDGATGEGARTWGQRRADGLADLCRAALGAAETPTGGDHRPQVTVTVGLETLRGGSTAGELPVATIGPQHQPIGAATARRLACDAGIIPVVLGSHGEPLDIGRLARTVPTGLRRAVELRDGGCRFPECDRPAARTQAHHIRHWSRGGPTRLTNLVLLCGFHHWLIHHSQWTVRIAADGHPEFIPPAHIDPAQRPRRNQYHRRQ